FPRLISVLMAVGAAALTATVVAGCGSTSSSQSKGGSAAGKPAAGKIQACVLLPDTKSSVRYVLFDRPYLIAAFRAAGVSSSVLNAQKSQGEQCLTNGAKVILVDALNSGVGASIEAEAAARGAQTIDYDRLVLHGKSSYYVSFNNIAVGKLQGKGVVAGL